MSCSILLLPTGILCIGPARGLASKVCTAYSTAEMLFKLKSSTAC